MKLIDNTTLLKIRAVDSLEAVRINEYHSNVWISTIDDKENYMIIKRQFENKYNLSMDKKIDLNQATCEIQNIIKLGDELKLEVNYGDENSFIVDMNGIDNFRFAKSLIFQDYDIRKMIIKLGLLDQNKKYFRFGCSGSRENTFHPGRRSI